MRRPTGREEKSKTDPNANRKWTAPVRKEYERHEATAQRRGKCKGKTIHGTDCPANASPSGSGYCSTHEQQGVSTGEKINETTVRPCADCKTNPADPRTESNLCPACYAKRAEAGQAFIRGEEPGITLPLIADLGDWVVTPKSFATDCFGVTPDGYCTRCKSRNFTHTPDCPVPEEVKKRKEEMVGADKLRSERKIDSPLRKILEQ